MENKAMTVVELKAKVDEWHAKRRECDDADDVLSAKNKELEAISLDLVKIMEILEIDKFEGSNGQKVRLHEDEYVTLPADEEKKAEFIQYLKDLGQWDNFATIHHHKLQSWHKAQQEEHGAMFMAPGLDLPKVRKSIRKTR